MSASKDAASPNKSAGGTSGSSWDTPLKSRVSGIACLQHFLSAQISSGLIIVVSIVLLRAFGRAGQDFSFATDLLV